MKMLVLGYIAIGALIGAICGVTESEITKPLVAALFAFIGGGVTFLVSKPDADYEKYGKILTAFCTSCLLFLVLGIYVKLHDLFSRVGPPGPAPSAHESVLKKLDLDQLVAIKQAYEQKTLTCEQALTRCFRLTQK